MASRAGLVEDARLPLLHTLWDESRLLTYLRERAPGIARDARSMRVVHMTYRPARVCVAAYAFDDDAPGVTVTIAKDERLSRAYAPETERAVYLSPERCLIEAFPHDYELPALADAWSGEGVLEAGEALVERPTVLAYRPHEAVVLEYEARTSAGERRHRVAKVIREPERVDHFVSVTKALREQVESTVLNVPASWRADGQPNVVVMEHAPGVSLHEALAASDEGRRRLLAERVAGAVTALHEVRHVGSPRDVRTLAGGLAHTRARTSRLAYASPELQARAEAVLDRVETLIPSDDVPNAFLHGDLKGSQLLVDGGALTLIDLDSAGMGDPAVDAGNFLADLHREAVLVGAYDARLWGVRLLDELVARDPVPGLAERARLFRVIALVRMAVHAFRQQPFAAGRPDFAPALLLEEAESCLRAL